MVAGALILSAWRKPGEPLRPSGLNFFSKQQDVQLGQEAAAEVRKQVIVVQNQFLQDYIQRIGKRLAAQPEAGDWPFNFTVVLDPNINAFALPGGPMFVNSGAIAHADNEAQIAGVMGHEMSHVILRHGTRQASKANLIQIPAMLAGAVIGNGSMLGQLAQLGIGLGANSVLLKYSRDDESQADALGTHLMAEAGYNPIELAHFFEKLQAAGGSRTLQFVSDHPNPGNREKAIEAEIRTLPQRKYSYEAGEFQRANAEVATLPAPPHNGFRSGGNIDPAGARPSGNLKTFEGTRFFFSYPDNWEVFGDQNSDSITIAPRVGLVQGKDGSTQIGYGVIASYFSPESPAQNVAQATDDLIHHLRAANPSLQGPASNRKLKVDGNPALISLLTSSSPLNGREETDALLTVSRPQGLFYMVFIAPSSEFRNLDGTYNEMVHSLRFRQ
jgi:hypothetical protein